MNVWFTRLLFLALALALIAIIFSIAPLEDQPRDPPASVILSPEAPPPESVVPPQDTD